MVPLRVPAAHFEATLRTLFESPTVGGVSLSIRERAAYFVRHPRRVFDQQRPTRL
jgi:hypothetical protein